MWIVVVLCALSVIAVCSFVIWVVQILHPELSSRQARQAATEYFDRRPQTRGQVEVGDCGASIQGKTGEFWYWCNVTNRRRIEPDAANGFNRPIRPGRRLFCFQIDKWSHGPGESSKSPHSKYDLYFLMTVAAKEECWPP